MQRPLRFHRAVHPKQPSLERRPAGTSPVRALITAADAFTRTIRGARPFGPAPLFARAPGARSHGIGLARLFALLSPVSRTRV